MQIVFLTLCKTRENVSFALKRLFPTRHTVEWKRLIQWKHCC